MKKAIPWNKIKAEYLQEITPREIAKKYNIKPQQIHNKAHRDNWTEEKESIKKNTKESVQNKIDGLTNLALDTLETILRDEKVEKNVKVQASKALLDVSGLKSSKVEQTNINPEPVEVKIIE